MALPILYRDEHLVIINKPTGLLVHRSPIDRHETRFALQILRDQIGQRVYPVHRLDKPTSGILVFALSSKIARQCGELISAGKFHKSYLAVVRGFTPDSGHIDHPLTEKADKYSGFRTQLDKPPRQAVTEFIRLASIELPVAVDRYPHSRYSLVQCFPFTGRKHQIRRHLKHISHPIIGDAKHGKGNHNRYFKENLDAGRLLLHADQLQLPHPGNGCDLTVTAPLCEQFTSLFTRFNWQKVQARSIGALYTENCPHLQIQSNHDAIEGL